MGTLDPRSEEEGGALILIPGAQDADIFRTDACARPGPWKGERPVSLLPPPPITMATGGNKRCPSSSRPQGMWPFQQPEFP